MLLFSLTGFFSFGKTTLSVQKNTMHLSLLNDSTSKALKKKENRAAKIATIMSACVPGLGQVYNKQYWKVPLIYGAFTGMGYLYLKNNSQYQTYREALIGRYDDDPTNDTLLKKYTEANLITLKDLYKKRSDLSMIGIGVVYILNVVDATVGAHLSHFEKKIDDDLSFGVKPYSTIFSTANHWQVYNGFTVQLNFCAKPKFTFNENKHAVFFD